jgi:hypothetical protein
MWSNASPYLLQLLLGTVAFVALLKDWKDYGRLSTKFGNFVPLVLAILTVFITGLGLRDTYQTRAAASADREQARLDRGTSQQHITQLSDQVTQLRQDNKNAADTFSKSFATLYSKFSDLQSKVQNADLLKEIKETKQQLEDTQKKLTQPKPVLIATFPANDPAQVPITETTLPRSDDVVTVQFAAFNSSDTAALNGSFIVRICEVCKYSEEPPGFVKVSGASDWDRQHDFQRIFPKSMIETFSVKVRIPTNVARFAISLLLACDACIAPTKQDLWINVK